MIIVKRRRWFLLLSLLVLLPATFSLLIPPTLRAGIDFTGGVAITVAFEEGVVTADVRDRVIALGHAEAIVQSLGGNAFFIRVGELPEGGRQELENALRTLSPLNVESSETISPAVGAETVRNAIIALVVASIAILVYITWAFRHVPNPFRYGACAIMALLHDVLIVLGVFSVLGKVADVEVNAMFITGVLAVIGYSINDTIVVFDRIRENVIRHVGSPLDEVVNLSIRETIGRSLNTSATTLSVVVALMLFGGSTIQALLLVLLVGIIVGTYSSIFVASLLLVAWDAGDIGRFFRTIRPFPARRQAS